MEGAFTIARYKTGKYSVERPLHIGAALGGADAPLLKALSAFALPLGEAFQLRDDLLGVFGAPSTTGKSVLDDLRAGKHTTLSALALRAADQRQKRTLQRLYGCPSLSEEQAVEVRGVMTATGAVHQVERLIHDRQRQALAALEHAPMPEAVRFRLRELATSAVQRTA